jgi:MobA/MobL family
MAIYHLRVKIGSKLNGDSAGNKCAYITRSEAYKNKADELAYTASGNMPKWPKTNPRDNPSHYWKAADIYERDNGRLYREIEFALPKELNLDEQKALCHAFSEKLATLNKGEKLPFTFAIHTDKENHNPHCHLMISERINDGISRNASTWFKRTNSAKPAKGGAVKTQELKGKQWLEPIRESWATMANTALKESAFAKGNTEFDEQKNRIDHRSLKAQGIPREPMMHMGAACSRMMAKGVPCHRGYIVAKANASIKKNNTVLRAYHHKNQEIKTMSDVIREIERDLKHAEQMRKETERMSLDTLRIETEISMMQAESARAASNKMLSDWQHDMKANFDLAKDTQQAGQSQVTGTSYVLANKPPTGAPPIPKLSSPYPVWDGLDMNLNSNGFTPSRFVLSKPTVSKLKR